MSLFLTKVTTGLFYDRKMKKKRRPGGRMVGANQKESFWSGKFGLLQTLMMLVEILLLLDLMVIYSITKKVQAFKVFKEDD